MCIRDRCDASSSGQSFVDALLGNPNCYPYAQLYISLCGVNSQGHYCLEELGDNIGTILTLQHPTISQIIEQCSELSESGVCTSSCRSAIETASNEFGCCINVFNNTIYGLVLAQLSGDALRSCGVDSSSVCTSYLNSSVFLRVATVWTIVAFVSFPLLVSIN